MDIIITDASNFATYEPKMGISAGHLLVQLAVVVGGSLGGGFDDGLLVGAQLVPAALGDGEAHAGVDVVATTATASAA